MHIGIGQKLRVRRTSLLDVLSLVPWGLPVKNVKVNGVDPSGNGSG